MKKAVIHTDREIRELLTSPYFIASHSFRRRQQNIVFIPVGMINGELVLRKLKFKKQGTYLILA